MEVGRVPEKKTRLKKKQQSFVCNFSHAGILKIALIVCFLSKQGPF